LECALTLARDLAYIWPRCPHLILPVCNSSITGRCGFRAFFQYVGYGQRVCRFPNLLRVRRAFRGLLRRHFLNRFRPMFPASDYRARRRTRLRQELLSPAPRHRQLLNRVRPHDALLVHRILAGTAGAGLLRRHRRRPALHAHRVADSDLVQHAHRPRRRHRVVRLLAR
jgi:hypothetical protein